MEIETFFPQEDGRKCLILEYQVIGTVMWESDGLYKVRYDRGGYSYTMADIFKSWEIQLL